ncbi:MAG: glutamate--tRNA ligase [Oscillibacter sp.]|nr:glutamate--tRNA ligase [Oscillibacter sp.]
MGDKYETVETAVKNRVADDADLKVLELKDLGLNKKELDLLDFDALEERIPRGKVRTRFAPSPTGYMHVGNLRTALYTWLIARHSGGTFILRIEDTDQNRQVEGAVDVIYKTMAQCGLDYDEGPDVGGPVGPYIQSERRRLYGKYAHLLVEKGAAYRCFCEKCQEEEDASPDGAEADKKEKYRKEEDPCRSLSAEDSAAKADGGMPYVIRQKIPYEGTTTFHDVSFGDITVENKDLDDQVLLKRDGLPTYNFANVVDDHLMGITHVVRGSEYLASAPKYNLLYEAFGWEIPAYVHCSPVMRDAHNKMSKRHGDPSYEDLIAQGYLTDAVLNYVALLGWSPRGEQAEKEFFTLQELAEAFDIAGISKSPAIFDIQKLDYFNAAYLRALTPEAFAEKAEPWIRKAVKNPNIDTAEIAGLLQARCEKLSDIPEKVDFFDALPEYGAEFFTNKKSKTNPEVSQRMLREAVEVLEEVSDWTSEAVHDALFGLAQKLEVKNATLLWPVRIAAAGKLVTPGGAVEICHILGKEETLRRLRLGLTKLEA